MGNADRVVDVSAAERPAAQRSGAVRPVAEPPTHPTRPGRHEAHLLRLSLDLQLDSLLCTLGAAAASGAPPPVRPRPSVGGPPPERTTALSADVTDAEAGGRGRTPTPTADRWHLWLAEDLELVETLATVAHSMDAPLPVALGGGATPDATAVPTALLVRFEAMRALLADVEARQDRGDLQGASRPAVTRAVERVDRRIEELRRHLDTLRRAGAGSSSTAWTAASRPVAASVDGARFIPGELLG